ncbi:hypothetical protein [Nannocystis pusilla]|uniref:hypothetical protein n=1 Tax=Nannocystis pusilla TaxID=889268 RepID=UPI003DA49EBF
MKYASSSNFRTVPGASSSIASCLSSGPSISITPPITNGTFGTSQRARSRIAPPSTWITESGGNVLSGVTDPAERAGSSSAGELTRSSRLPLKLLTWPFDVTWTATFWLSRTVEPSIFTSVACT